ncbi:CDP-glycerol glycerophosphotransferase family protein [Solibaculum mannosilyticum]|uniref:Uncharacterized protein n=1 Tax=Solibaculum mannosilyticum TaxID=2780922 RepID=A0A7I8D685_9FIRM|nr:CDP-glycerol glycerophosphotransferase family protein [Solibaculum mannosilyticum]BCI61242.1 hypothetical protein C12CBH8_18810 [Solibaculum mannosilyticum]
MTGKDKKTNILQSLRQAPSAMFKGFVTRVFCLLPLKKYIMFESTNDFDGNAGAFYTYLKQAGVLEEYKAVWVTKNNSYTMPEVITVPRNPSSIKQYLRRQYYGCVSKFQFWDNAPIRKRRKRQVNVNLSHGALPYKMVAPLSEFPDFTDFAVSPSEQCYQYKKRSWNISDKVEPLYSSLPRNDVFAGHGWDELSKICGDKKYRKVIIWMPTFRAHVNGKRNDSTKEYPYGIPVIYCAEDFDALNEQLKKLDILLLVKHHPRSIQYLSLPDLSNVAFWHQLDTQEVDFCKLLTQMDALISDYSSVVFDYMLLDRPIAWTLDDLDSYKPKFTMEDPMSFMPGNHIYRFDDLMDFIKQVSSGEDIFREQRNDLRIRLGLKDYGRGCETIADFLGLTSRRTGKEKAD